MTHRQLLPCLIHQLRSNVVLSTEQIDEFRRTGHLTVPAVFSGSEIQAALDDLDVWSQEFLASLSADEQTWYLERDGAGKAPLRKLDHPAFHRPAFTQLARHPALVAMVQQLIGQPVSIFFSQVFMKPPEVGGPKPIHQDNFYFGPDDADATLTAWVALDDATIENGCLYYCNTHQTEVATHLAPDGEPFNLQIPAETASKFAMLAAPVPRGGVSFHHGNTPHQSSANRSTRPRRAAAFHYLREDATLSNPALDYDPAFCVKVSGC